MEEVWRDISLSCLHSPLNPNSSAHRHSLLLQDFLASPRGKDLNSPAVSRDVEGVGVALPTTAPGTSPILGHNRLGSSIGDVANCGSDKDCSFVGPVPQPVLGSAATSSPSFISALMNSPFEALASSSSPSQAPLLNPFCRKRDSEKNDACPRDRRHKRMMKNRESAARSRARRQAYTFELERKRSLLIEENVILRRELKEQESRSAAAPAAAARLPQAPPEKNPLSRSLSAPF